MSNQASFQIYQKNFAYELGAIAALSGLASGIAAFEAGVLTSLNPVGAAIYAGTSTFAGLTTKITLDEFGGKSSSIADVATWSIAAVSGLLTGVIVSSLAGHTITVLTGTLVTGALALTTAAALASTVASIGVAIIGIAGAIMLITDKNPTSTDEQPTTVAQAPKGQEKSGIARLIGGFSELFHNEPTRRYG